MPKPGPHLQPVQDVETVFSVDLARHNSVDGDVNPKAFNLNPKSKDQSPWRKSVWDIDLTQPSQVVNILDNPDRRVPVYIDVEDIRGIDLQDAGGDVTVTMDVVWDRLQQVIPNFQNFPGHKGHCGITGWPEGKGPDKIARRQIRARLADRAHATEEIEPTQQQAHNT